MEAPEVRYARSGDVAIASQVIGDGPRDVVLVPDWISNLVWAWHSPYWRSFYERIGSFSRLIVFDKRGTGVSDRPRFYPDLETRIEVSSTTPGSAAPTLGPTVRPSTTCWSFGTPGGRMRSPTSNSRAIPRWKPT